VNKLIIKFIILKQNIKKVILLKDYPNINMDKFYDALMGIICMVKNNEIITYHCDIEKALRCGIENRNLNIWEWD